MRVERWDAVLTTDESNQILSALSGLYLEEIRDTGIRSDLSRLLREKDWPGLCLYELPLVDEQSYRAGRQILAFFQKRRDLSIPGHDPTQTAWDTFTKAEALCLETNRIFRQRSQGGFYFPPRVESILFIAQRKISAILGDLPSLEDLRLRFGPGATTQVKKRDASARRKLAQVFSCSEASIRFLPDLLGEVPLWSQASACENSVTVDVRIDNARVDFVRKTAKTDRTIAVEPMLSGMVQIAVGDFIAGRLKQFGVDLRDQSRNKALAREGSITGALATLDLSSASDTVSCGLVEDLLPFEWWDFLRGFRSSHVESPQGVLRLEKFSTMGNGFTFALESLIFFAVAKAAVEYSEIRGPVSVYGDDIIVPSGSFDLVVECLKAIGFLVNEKKSFSTGPFRESCGGDYYSGTSVRPCYVKDSLSGADLFIMHNFFVREGRTDISSLVRRYISDDLAIYGPDGFGDGHLLGEYVPEPHGRDRGWAGYTFETFTWKAKNIFYKKPFSADYVFPAYSIYVSLDADVDASTFSGKGLRKRSHGVVRPPGQQSRYRGSSLSDTLPGVQGYKRIKIYTLHRP